MVSPKGTTLKGQEDPKSDEVQEVKDNSEPLILGYREMVKPMWEIENVREPDLQKGFDMSRSVEPAD